MTKQECIENHRKMWNWIADETEKRKDIVRKDEYFEAMRIPYEWRPLFECYACDFCKTNCENCPIDWGGGKKCYTDNSPFNKWGEALVLGSITPLKYYKEAARFAREIANLPWKNDEKTEN